MKSEKQESFLFFFSRGCEDFVPSFQGQVQRVGLMSLVVQMTCFP